MRSEGTRSSLRDNVGCTLTNNGSSAHSVWYNMLLQIESCHGQSSPHVERVVHLNRFLSECGIKLREGLLLKSVQQAPSPESVPSDDEGYERGVGLATAHSIPSGAVIARIPCECAPSVPHMVHHIQRESERGTALCIPLTLFVAIRNESICAVT